MGSEKAFENKIKTYIKAVDGYVVKYHGNAYSTNGTPDLLACVNGYFQATEVKAQGGHPSELQLKKIEDIRKAGGLAFVVYPSGWFKLKSIIDGLAADTFNREREVELK